MRMNTLGMIQIAVGVLITTLGLSGWAQAAQEPVNPHATPEARALLAYLGSISGKAIITGQHNYPNEGSRWTDLAYDLTANIRGFSARISAFPPAKTRIPCSPVPP